MGTEPWADVHGESSPPRGLATSSVLRTGPGWHSVPCSPCVKREALAWSQSLALVQLWGSACTPGRPCHPGLSSSVCKGGMGLDQWSLFGRRDNTHDGANTHGRVPGPCQKCRFWRGPAQTCGIRNPGVGVGTIGVPAPQRGSPGREVWGLFAEGPSSLPKTEAFLLKPPLRLLPRPSGVTHQPCWVQSTAQRHKH